jgi:hypothetical protein
MKNAHHARFSLMLCLFVPSSAFYFRKGSGKTSSIGVDLVMNLVNSHHSVRTNSLTCMEYMLPCMMFTMAGIGDPFKLVWSSVRAVNGGWRM